MQIATGLILLITIWTSFFAVPADSVGIVTRFGILRPLAPPGLHLKWPWGIDRVEIIPTLRQMKQEFGYGTPGASYIHQFAQPAEQRRERNMVTGDLNAVLVEWVVQFRITDPESFLFKVRNADETLRDSSECVMREVVGDRSVDEVITVGRQEVEIECKKKLQSLADSFQLGVTVDQVQLNNVDPPEPVQSSFSEVNQAQQEREQAVNIANGEYNKVVPRAKGEADQKIREAEGYALKRVNEAEGDATRFNAIFTEYQKSPEVTRRRMYLETMAAVLPTLSRPMIMDPSIRSILPTLALPTAGNPEPPSTAPRSR